MYTDHLDVHIGRTGDIVGRLEGRGLRQGVSAVRTDGEGGVLGPGEPHKDMATSAVRAPLPVLNSRPLAL